MIKNFKFLRGYPFNPGFTTGIDRIDRPMAERDELIQRRDRLAQALHATFEHMN